jgi:aminoglycoside 3-N-acetyltransferase I
MTITFHKLGPADGARCAALNRVFASAFDDVESYASAPPSAGYLQNLLAQPHIHVLVAQMGDQVIGGLTAYTLHKLEQARAEIYINDLAVLADHRRKGAAQGLIALLQDIAAQIGAYVIFVQADYGDDPAIALYTKLGQREEVLHFDISPAN